MNARRAGVSTICAMFSRVGSKTSGSALSSRKRSTSAANSCCSAVKSKSMSPESTPFLTGRQICQRRLVRLPDAMAFTFTDDQEQLRRAVRQLGGESDVWRRVTEQLGLTGIGIDPERGGAGGDFVDAAALIEEAGRALLPAPVTTVLVAAAVLGRAGGEADELAGAVARGERIVVIAVGEPEGTIDNVLDGDRADAFLIAGEDG